MSRDFWKAASGILCVYKNSGVSSTALKKTIVNRIVKDVPEMDIRLPTISLPIVEAHETSGALLVVGTREMADYRYHPLVRGKSVREEDIDILDALPLETTQSGVCLFGINEGCRLIPKLMANSWVNVYRIDGIFRPTEDKSGSWQFSRHRLEKVISRMVSEFRAASFQYANVDIQSEEAFELARRGLPRSQLPGAQIVYSIDLNWFTHPRFSISVHSSGEDNELLKNLVKHIGANIGVLATTTRLQRRFFGPFGGEDALLEKQINLQNILRNIQFNKLIIEKASAGDKKVIEDREKLSELSEKRSREIFDGLGLTESTNLEDYDAMKPAWPRNYS